MIGSITYDTFSFTQNLYSEINSLSSHQVNKYFVSSLVVLIFNFFSLILNLTINGFRFNLSRRVVALKEQYEFQTEITIEMGSNRKETISNTLQNKSESLSVRSSINKPSLVLFSNAAEDDSDTNKKNDSNESRYLDSIMEKEEIDEDNSPRDYDSFSNQREELFKTPLQSKRNFNKNENVKENENGNNEENDNLHTQFDEMSIGKESNYHEDEKQYQEIENDTKIITDTNANNMSNVVTPRLINLQLNDDIKNTSKIEIFEMESKQKSVSNKNINDKMRRQSELQEKEKEEYSNKIGSSSLEDSENNKSQIISRRGSVLSSHNKQILFINSFKISMIFTMIQISDVMLFNLFIFSLFLPVKSKGFYQEIYSIGFCLAVVYFFNSVVTMIFRKYTTNNKKSNQQLKKTMKINLIISIIITNVLIIPLALNFLNEIIYIKIFIYSILIIIRNATIGNCLIVYNFIISSFESTKLKEKINNYQSYFSYVMRALTCILSCILCSYVFLVNKKSENFDFKFLLLSGVYSIPILTIFCFLKYI